MIETKPPRNMRREMPRVCGTCRHFIADNYGEADCALGDVIFDLGDGNQWLTTCDRWSRWWDSKVVPTAPGFAADAEANAWHAMTGE